MFRATNTKEIRERKVRSFLESEPGISVLLAAVNFEWTVGRAMMFLSASPNNEVRSRLGSCSGLRKYKELWKLEVATNGHKGLAEIVRNWSAVQEAFLARHRLVHGRDGCTQNMAKSPVDVLLTGVGYVEDYCKSQGVSLSDRMPVRLVRRQADLAWIGNRTNIGVRHR
jgi:hypothetical protein